MEGATPYDLVLRGGTLVEADGSRAVDLALAGGRVAAHLGRGQPAAAVATLDITGLLLLPGLVDAHVHLREPGLTHKEDFGSGTAAAAAGGVTTVLVMPTDDPWTDTPDRLAAKAALTPGRLRADVAFQVAVRRDGQDLAALAAAGAVSFEVFTADVPPAYRHDTVAALAEALRGVAACGGLVGLQPSDATLLAAAARDDDGSIAGYGASRPALAEVIGVADAVLVAAATGARVHVRQISTIAALDAWRRLRGAADVTIETSVQNLLLTATRYADLGSAIKAAPPFRDAVDVQALQGALRDGTIDMVVTDHAPHRADEKQGHARFSDVPGGLPGLQTLLPCMLHLVDRGVLTLPDVVRLCAATPAARFGFGGRKGSLGVGCDADVVILDPARRSTVGEGPSYSKAGVSPFAGLSVPYRLKRVLLRGYPVWTVDGLGPAAPGLRIKPNPLPAALARPAL